MAHYMHVVLLGSRVQQRQQGPLDATASRMRPIGRLDMWRRTEQPTAPARRYWPHHPRAPFRASSHIAANHVAMPDCRPPKWGTYLVQTELS